MRTQTSQKAEPFARAPMKILLGVFAIFLCAVIFLTTTLHTSAATLGTVNFQARLENSTGSIAADGNYNIQFKLYSASSGGSALWTETYQNSASQGVTVTNGYVTVNLGSLTAFPSTINWDQDLYLTMNIGGTSTGASPTYDGEMTPRLKLTAVPYAFRAGQLATYNGATGYTSTLSILVPTGGNQTFQIPDQGAAGTYNLLTTNTANNSFIQLQASTPGTPQTGNFNISGTGIASLLQAANFDTSSAGTLGIGATNATAISLGQNVTVASGKTLLVQGATTIQPAGGSTSALKVVNSGGSNVFRIDSSNNAVILGQANLQGELMLADGGAGAYVLDIKASGMQALGASRTIIFNGGNLTTTRTLTLPDESGTICTTASVCAGYAGGTNYIQNQIAVQQASSNFWISGNGRIDGSVLTPTLDTAAAGTLNIGTTNATTINVGTNGATHTIAIGTSTSAAQTITVGSSNASTTLGLTAGASSLAIANGGLTVTGNTTTNGTISTTVGGAAGAGTQPLASNLYIQSRTENLVTNGLGLLGNNYNFSNFTYDPVNVYAGEGSFKNSTFNAVVLSDELVQVDPNATYALNLAAESTVAVAGAHSYFGVAPYDIDGSAISPWQYSKYVGSTDTTLAAPLNPGDTTVTLTNATGWSTNAAGYSRNFAWYGYTNSRGYTYPDYTYTHNSSVNYSDFASNGAWATTGISGNVITLRAPWSGPALASGTSIRNNTSGAQYKYIAASNVVVPSTWTQYSGRIGGLDVNGTLSTNLFPYGTAYVKMLFLMNRDVAGNTTNISDITFTKNSGVFQAQTSSVIPVVIQGSTSQTADLLQLQNATGSVLSKFDSAGNLVVSATGNSTFAGNLIVTGAVQGGSFDAASTVALSIGNINATSIVIGKLASNIQTTVSGILVVKPTTGNDSATAFLVQTAGGSNLLTADTINSKVTFKSASTDAVLGAAAIDTAGGTNDFPTGWTTAGWTVAANSATNTGGNTNALISTWQPTAGTTYQVSYSYTNCSASNYVTITLGLSTVEASGACNGTNTVLVTAATTSPMRITPQSGYTGTISNIVVRAVTTQVNPVLAVANSSGTATLEVRSSGVISNIFIGVNAGKNNTSSGTQNTALGTYALQNNTTGYNNTALGFLSLEFNTTGVNNSAVGAGTLQNNTTGYNNNAFGMQSLFANTTGSNNTAFGVQSLTANTTGSSNTASGHSSLYSNTTGSSNVASGYASLYSNTTGSSNTGTGFYSLYYNTTGNGNTAFGIQSLENNTTGSFNSALGYYAGYLDSGNFFGSGAAIQNATSIGAFSQVQASNSIVLGSVDTPTKIGIGITVPSNTFSVSPLDYQTGTATRTNSSTTLVGTGTTWTSSMVGDSIVFTDGTTNTVSAFTDATHITMGTTYAGTTDASPVHYRFHKIGLQVTSAGNVGLGTVSPAYALDVVGSTNVSGTSYANILQGTTSINTPLLDTVSAGVLNVGTTNATGINLNKNVTVAAGQYLSLVGGITSTRPASPTEGMLYYDTTTKSLIVYANGKWISYAGNTATKIVGTSASGGASGAVASQSPDGADYVNSSTTSAQTTINTAISALPTGGGTIFLMDGTYIIDGSINVPNNTQLIGAGPNTIIKFKNSIGAGTFYAITNSDTSTGTSITISNLALDGNSSNNATGTPSMSGIYMNFFSSGSGSSAKAGAKISNIYASNFRNNGVYLYFSNNTTITNVTTRNNSVAGIYVHQSYNNVLTNNISQGNTSYGYYISASNNDVFNDNIAQGSFYGFMAFASSHDTFTGNNVNGNSLQGMNFNGSANDNIITGNRIYDNGGASTNNGLYFDASSTNTVVGNHITDTSATTNNYAINVSNSTSVSNYFASNTLGTGSINDLGTATIYSNQVDVNGNLINRNQGGLTVGTLTTSATLSLQGSIKATQLPAPSAPTVTTTGTAGSTSRTYAVTAYDGFGETLASTGTTLATTNATLDTNNYVNISWAQVGGAVSYKIYRTASAGTPSTTGLIATVNANVFTVKDTGLAASGSTPAANTTGGASFAGAVLSSTFDTASATALSIGGTTASSINLGNSTSNIQTTIRGTVLFKPTTGNDSATAFQIQNAAGTSNLLTADTSGMQLVVGTTTNGIILSSSGVQLKGTARNAKVITLTAEYAGAVLDAGSGSNNSGTMTSGIDLTNRMNFYKWTTTQATNQSYDIDVQVPIPSDFDSWNSNPVSVKTYTSDTTNGTITLEARDTGGTVICNFVSVTPGSTTTWTTNNTACTLSSGTYTAGGYMTLRVRLQAPTSGDVRIGNIVLSYLSKY